MFLDIQRVTSGDPATPLVQMQSSTHLLLSNNRVRIRLGRRASFPSTYCQQMSEGDFQLGYGNLNPSKNEEFLIINVRADGAISVLRDIRATLPLFYGYSKDFFVLNNDYGSVIEALPHLTLNEDDVILSLAPRRFHHPTLWNEVSALRSGEVLQVDNGKSPTKSVATARTWVSSDDAPRSDPEEFLPRLDDTLAQTIQRYASSSANSPPAFEVSGGIDSSSLLLYRAQMHPHAPWHGMSILYPGLREVTQANKLHAISEYAPSGTIKLVSASDMYDSAPVRFTALNARPFNPHEAASIGSLEEVATTFEKAGVTTLFHGVGGDELFDHNKEAQGQLDIGEKAMQHVLEQLPDFFTNHFYRRFRILNKKDEKYTLPVLSTGTSWLDPSSNVYINHGIWPVSPFLDTEFYTYCQGLPYKFKHDKHILRIYYRAKKWPLILYGETYPNEDPGDVFEKPFLTDEFAQIIEEMAENSILGHLGYVDIPQLLQIYRDIRRGTLGANKGVFFISLWLNVEFNLRLAQRSGQWRPVVTVTHS